MTARLAAFALVLLPAASSGAPRIVTDVSDDGQLTHRYELGPDDGGALLLDWGSVPFGGTPVDRKSVV